MSGKQDRRKAAYRAWLEGHTPEQAIAVVQTVIMLETLPGSSRSVGIQVLINMLRRIGSDLCAVTGRPVDAVDVTSACGPDALKVKRVPGRQS